MSAWAYRHAGAILLLSLVIFTVAGIVGTVMNEAGE